MTDRTPSNPTPSNPSLSNGGSATPSSSTSSTAAPAPSARTRIARWITIGVAAAFGIVYAYYLWDAIRSMIELPAQYELVGLGRENAPWTLLVAGVIVPVAVYIAALIAGARRAILSRALIFLISLGALACLSLTVIALG